MWMEEIRWVLIGFFFFPSPVVYCCAHGCCIVKLSFAVYLIYVDFRSKLEKKKKNWRKCSKRTGGRWKNLKEGKLRSSKEERRNVTVN